MRPPHEVLIGSRPRKGVSQLSRRGVLALTPAAPAALGLNTVLAQVDAEWGNDGNRRRNRRTNSDEKMQRRSRWCNRGSSNGNGYGNRTNDIRILNQALTLEHLEYALYPGRAGPGRVQRERLRRLRKLRPRPLQPPPRHPGARGPAR